MYSMTSVFLPLSPRDNLPPPSGQDQIICQTSPSILTPTVKLKLTQKYAGGNLDTSIKPVHNQVNGVPNNVEKVSMKPPGVI